MSVAGIIFSNPHNYTIPELTRKRTSASVPFVCRYRLIDFALSNMVNSGITDINVVAQYNYRSLMDHIGSGKDWDLARRAGGIKILPPLISAYSDKTHCSRSTRLEALKSISAAIMRITADYVVLSDSDCICNIDIGDIINTHKKSGADITLTVKPALINRNHTNQNKSSYSLPNENENAVIISDSRGKVQDIIFNTENLNGYYDKNINITVINRIVLQTIIIDSAAHGYTDFMRDIISRNTNNFEIRVYKFNSYFSRIISLSEYFICSMSIVSNATIRAELFERKDRPIYTKVRNSPPTKYGESAKIKNSLIADGCIIDGKVENSILFRGVKIPKQTVVRNSILFQDTFIGENCSLSCVVADKNVVIRDGRTLSGHEIRPYFIEKGMML